MNKEIYVIVGEGQDEGVYGVISTYTDQKKAKADLKLLKKRGYGSWEDFHIHTYPVNEFGFELNSDDWGDCQD